MSIPTSQATPLPSPCGIVLLAHLALSISLTKNAGIMRTRLACVHRCIFSTKSSLGVEWNVYVFNK